MVTVTIEGVRRNFWRSDLYIVSLWDESERHLLNITIGQQEAYMLVMNQQRIEVPRPTTFHFMANAFNAMGVTAEEVRIEQLQYVPFPVFCAVVRLRNGEIAQELDARPSDALNLAALTTCPISVSEKLLEQAGIVLPEEKTPEIYYAEQLLKHEGIALPEGKKLRLGYSKVPARDAMIKEIKAVLLGAPLPQPPTEKEFERAKKNYLAFLLGDDFTETN